MHGIIFTSLKKYVTANLGAEGWTTLAKEAGVGNKIYLASQTYSDQEIVSLVTTASRITGKPAPAILEDFGEFIVPELVAIYRSMIKPDWKALDLIENVESTIHRAVRLRDPSATPPYLVCSRPSQEEVVITYSSPRKLCSVAKGIARGVGKHYGERLSITETSCMHRGNPNCRLSIKAN